MTMLSPGGVYNNCLWWQKMNRTWRVKSVHVCVQMRSHPGGSDSSARQALLGNWGGWWDRVSDWSCIWGHWEELLPRGQQYLLVYETHSQSNQVILFILEYYLNPNGWKTCSVGFLSLLVRVITFYSCLLLNMTSYLFSVRQSNTEDSCFWQQQFSLKYVQPATEMTKCFL